MKGGYFKKYRHGKTGQNDELCFGKEAETQIYQIVYFLLRGELMDLDTVMDDVYLLFRNTGRYCGVYETSMKIYFECTVGSKCNPQEMINNLETHLMKIVEIGMSVMDLVTSRGRDKFDNPKEFGDTMNDIGEDIGEFIVSLFGI